MSPANASNTGRSIPREMDPWLDQVMPLLEQENTLPLRQWLADFEGVASEASSTSFLVEVLIEAKSCTELLNAPWETVFERLIRTNPSLDSLIRNANYHAWTDRSFPTEAPVFGPRSGAKLRDYCVEGLIGKGKQGAVYQGFSPPLNRSAAIKVFNRDFAEITPDALEREARRLEALPHHSSLLAFHEYFPTDQGECLAAEYISGVSVAKRYLRSPPSPEIIVEWMWRMADGLDAAHSVGVYHRDLNPNNVLIETASGIPKLIDFGLGYDDNPLSEDHQRALPAVGTIPFMAPEIAASVSADREQTNVTVSWQLVDIYGLGAIFYFLATGEPPLGSGNATDLKNGLIEYQVNDGLLRSSSLDGKLQEVCLKALSIHPSDRYANAKEFQQALETAAPHLCPRAKQATNNQPSIPGSDPLGVKQLTLAVVVTLVLALALFASNLLNRSAAPHAPATSQSGPHLIAGDKPLSELHSLAIEQGLDFASISKSDFQVRIRTGKRATVPWSVREETDWHRAQIRVTVSERLVDFSQSLQFRIGKRSWQWMSLDDTTQEVYGLLTTRDLDVDGPVQLRLGGTQDWAQGHLAGPFEYPLSIREQIALDEAMFLQEQIVAASNAPCFDMTQAGWKLRRDFESKYGPIIKAIRFGRLRDRLDHKAISNEPKMTRELSTHHPLSTTCGLCDSFAVAARDIQDANALWRVIVFIDGTTSKPAKYQQRNRFGHDGSIESAKKLLIDMDDSLPKGQLQGNLFVMDGLARVASSLSHVEFGVAPAKLTNAYPVRIEHQSSGMHLAYGHAEKSRNGMLLNKHNPLGTGDGKLFRVFDGVSLSPIVVPSSWSRICFRGRYHDGTTTRIFEARNSNAAPGFQLQLTRVLSGTLEIPVYLSVVAKPDLSSAFSAPSFDLKGGANNPNNAAISLGSEPDGNSPAEITSALFGKPTSFWPPKVELYALLPSPAESVEYHEDMHLTKLLQAIEPGTTFYVSFRDAKNHRIGCCEYYVVPDSLERSLHK